MKYLSLHTAFIISCVLDTPKIQNLKFGEWNSLRFEYLSPEPRRKSNPLKAFVWFRGQDSLYVRNLRAEIYVREDW